jgi:CBS domain-containing protein
MTGGVECVGVKDSVLDAAKRLSELDVGSMPICGEDDRLQGMLADRDIVVTVARGGPGSLERDRRGSGSGKPVMIGADDPVDEALHTKAEHKVRRLPVIDGMIWSGS